MLYRKISTYIEQHLRSNSDKILVVEGARQIGKSYIIREVGKQVFSNFVEINFVADDEGDRLFKQIRTTLSIVPSIIFCPIPTIMSSRHWFYPTLAR